LSSIGWRTDVCEVLLTIDHVYIDDCDFYVDVSRSGDIRVNIWTKAESGIAYSGVIRDSS